MAYTLYIGNKRYSSWSMRPWVLLKALRIPFDESLQIFEPGTRQPQFISFSPSSKVPCLHDSDTGIVIWDSLAICEYIAEAYPEAWPKDKAARAFARCAAAEMHSGFETLRNECSMNVGLRIDLARPLSKDLERDLLRIEALWGEGTKQFGGPWLAGESFTAVDAFFAPVATRVQTYGIQLCDGAMDYVERLLKHPAVDAWVQDGIKEPAREPFHEEDCVRDRKVLKDLSAEASM